MTDDDRHGTVVVRALGRTTRLPCARLQENTRQSKSKVLSQKKIEKAYTNEKIENGKYCE